MFLVVFGAGLMAASVLWEYTRMRPDYRFIVNPWSLRGLQTTQGLVICAIGVALILLALAVGTRRLAGSIREAALIAAGVVAVATLIPVIAGAGEVRFSAAAAWILALLAGLAAQAVTARLLPQTLGDSLRRLILIGVFIAVVALTGLLVFDPLLGDKTAGLWLVVLIAMLLFSATVLARRPVELAAHRLLISGAIAGWVIALTSSGAVRSTLLRLQLEKMGMAAEYRDIQITAGILVAWLGGLLAFVGAVALWAKRRDQLEEHTRARRQMEVARESAAELGQTV